MVKQVNVAALKEHCYLSSNGRKSAEETKKMPITGILIKNTLILNELIKLSCNS